MKTATSRGIQPRSPSALKLSIQALLIGDLRAVRSQRRGQTHVVERARMQIVREVPDLIGQGHRPGLQRPQRVVQLSSAEGARCRIALIEIDNAASCWLKSSCMSRAMRERSVSWAPISRPASRRARA